eukprot:6963492-Ditylum_brightwellii.AAC.1
MFFYTLELDEESKELCTIAMPFGKLQYCRMAMGLKIAQDVAQAIIEEIVCGTRVEAYLDDVGIFTNGDYDKHMRVVGLVLKCLQENGMKVNPLKCECAVQETDFLGHWLTQEGIKPWKKKVEAVLKLAPPEDMTQLRAFIGAVTYYKNIWPR